MRCLNWVVRKIELRRVARMIKKRASGEYRLKYATIDDIVKILDVLFEVEECDGLVYRWLVVGRLGSKKVEINVWSCDAYTVRVWVLWQPQI